MFIITVHTCVPSNGILPMLCIPNRQNLLPELYHTEFSVPKIPFCKQLLFIIVSSISSGYDREVEKESGLDRVGGVRVLTPSSHTTHRTDP